MFKHLDRIRTFIAAVDCQSFTQAAEKLFISKAMASMHIKAFSLLNCRTTQTNGVDF